MHNFCVSSNAQNANQMINCWHLGTVVFHLWFKWPRGMSSHLQVNTCTVSNMKQFFVVTDWNDTLQKDLQKQCFLVRSFEERKLTFGVDHLTAFSMMSDKVNQNWQMLLRQKEQNMNGGCNTPFFMIAGFVGHWETCWNTSLHHPKQHLSEWRNVPTCMCCLSCMNFEAMLQNVL